MRHQVYAHEEHRIFYSLAISYTSRLPRRCRFSRYATKKERGLPATQTPEVKETTPQIQHHHVRLTREESHALAQW